MSISQKLTKAKSLLMLDHPFFGALLVRLPLQESTCYPTAATDGKKIYYNASWIASLTILEVVGVLAHEVLHVAMLHHTRRGWRDQHLWNVACDYAINWILEEAGIRLPASRLLDYRFRGRSAEWIYDWLLQHANADPQLAAVLSRAKSGLLDPSGCGAVIDLPSSELPGQPATPSEISEHEAQVAVMAKSALSVARAQGKSGPEDAKEMLLKIHAPALPWREILARFISSSVAITDYTWIKPNRRYDEYLPSLYARQIDRIVVAVDTSGSVSEDMLVELASEVHGILQQFRPGSEIVLISADDAVRGVQYVSADDDLLNAVRLMRGYGTDYRPVFAWIAENESDDIPALIYLTDGQCDLFPPVEPLYPVLWVLSDENRYFKPPFGETICIRQR